MGAGDRWDDRIVLRIMAKALDAQIRQTLRLARQFENAGAKEVKAILDQLRRQIVIRIVEAGEISPSLAAQIKEEVDRLMQQFSARLSQQMSANERRLFIKGVQSVDAAIKGAGLVVALPFVSEQILTTLAAYNADLITGVLEPARMAIRREIALGVMGQKPVTEIVKAIGRNLTSPSVFGTLYKRALAIYKTEMHRVQNEGANTRMTQAQQRVPDLRKMWLHSHQGIPRPHHLMLDGVTIKPDEKFKLIGADGKIYEIEKPHDAALPASEVVGCRCIVTGVPEKQPEKKA